MTRDVPKIQVASLRIGCRLHSRVADALNRHPRPIQYLPGPHTAAYALGPRHVERSVAHNESGCHGFASEIEEDEA